MKNLHDILGKAVTAGIMSELDAITMASAVMFTSEVTATRPSLRFEFTENYGKTTDAHIGTLINGGK